MCVATACTDGQDNDGDGLTDAADPGCLDANDDDERGPDFDCDNGLDDDLDGFTDFPDDPQCDDAFDTESVPVPAVGAAALTLLAGLLLATVVGSWRRSAQRPFLTI